MVNVPYHTHQFSVPTATQAEAEAGVLDNVSMTPLTTSQAIEAIALTPEDAGSVGLDILASTTQAEAIAAVGVDTSNFLQPLLGLVADWNGTTGTDNYAILNAAVATGKNWIVPSGNYAYRGTIKQTSPYQVIDLSGASFTWLGHSDGTMQAYCMWIIDTPATGAKVINGKLDHRGQLLTSSTSLPASANVALESMTMVMADHSGFYGTVGYNSFDNGFAVGRFNLTTGGQVNGAPWGAHVESTYTENCGCGVRTSGVSTGKQAGGGVNVLTGGGAVIANCVDEGSRTNFILGDYGGGASGVASNLIGRNAKASVGGLVGGEPVAGYGIYNGGSFKIHNTTIWLPENTGVWFDGFSTDSVLHDVDVRGGARRGFLIQGRNNTIINPNAIGCSLGNTGVYDAIEVLGSQDNGAGSMVDSKGLVLINPRTSGTSHRKGLVVNPSGSVKAFGGSIGGELNGNGQLAVDNQQTGSFAVVNFKDSFSAQNISISDAVQELRKTNTAASGTAFGTLTSTGMNGHVWYSDKANPGKGIAIGLDPTLLTNGGGVLQGLYRDNFPLPIAINPSGGAVTINNSPAMSQASLGSMAYDGVGTYSMLKNLTAGTFAPGDTTNGSNLGYTSSGGGNLSGVPIGVWVCLGRASAASAGIDAITIWRRVS